MLQIGPEWPEVKQCQVSQGRQTIRHPSRQNGVHYERGQVMNSKDGGPAFPAWFIDYDECEPTNPPQQGPRKGMSLRDWFASMAMSGFLTRGDTLMRPYTDVSHDAYKMADAMLTAKEEQE